MLQSFLTWNLGSWSTCRSWTLRTAWAEYFCGSGIHTCHIVDLRASRLMEHRHSGSWKAFWFWGRLAWATGQEPPARRPFQVSDILSKFTVFGCKDFGGWDKWGRSKTRNGQQLCQMASTSIFYLRKCWNYQIEEVSLCMSTWPENPFGSGPQRTTRWALWRPVSSQSGGRPDDPDISDFWFQQEVSQMPGHHSHVTNRAQKSTLVFFFWTGNSLPLWWKLTDIGKVPFCCGIVS